MSRIGNKAITLPAGVTVDVQAKNFVNVKGPKGELSFQFNSELEIATEGSECVVKRPNDTKTMKMMHGTTRALLHNMVVGVSDGFKKVLEINGVGYRAALQGNKVGPPPAALLKVELRPSGTTPFTAGLHRCSNCPHHSMWIFLYFFAPHIPLLASTYCICDEFMSHELVPVLLF